MGVSGTIYLGWSPTPILPISASQVAKITGMSYPHPHNFFLIVKKEFFECMDASVLPGF
jgi:hypothetical protein